MAKKAAAKGGADLPVSQDARLVASQRRDCEFVNN